MFRIEGINYTCSSNNRRKIQSRFSIAIDQFYKGNLGNQEKPEAFDGDITNNALAISPDEKIAVVSYSKIPGIKVYDLEEKKVIAELDAFVTPRNIAFSKDGKYFYVSDSSYGSIREFSAETLELTNTFHLEQGVFGFAITNDGKRIFANNQFNSTVTVVNLETGTIDQVIEGFSRPRQGIVIDSQDTYAYVTNFEGNDVRVVFITGYDYFDYAQNAIRIGIDDYLLKPVSKKDIIELLKMQTGYWLAFPLLMELASWKDSC